MYMYDLLFECNQSSSTEDKEMDYKILLDIVVISSVRKLW